METLPEQLGTMRPSEELREKLRQRALSSTFFMGKAVIGFKDLDPDLHGTMSRWIQQSYPGRRALGLAPRDHLKSSVWTIADTVRRVTVDPNIRILIENEILENSKHFLARIKAVFERSQMYQWLFPERIPNFNDVRWTQTEIELPRTQDYPEATIEVIGVGGASTSRHYNLIKEDDLVGKEASESPAVMQKALDQHMLAESLLNSPADEIQTYGTRWAVFDLARWMYDHEPDLDHFRLAIYKPDGTPIWPVRFDAKAIENLRRKYTPAMFALQYLNLAIAEGNTEFSRDWLRYYKFVERNGKTFVRLERPQAEGGPYEVAVEDCERYQMVDPGLNPETGECRTANVVVALTPTRPFDVVVLEAQAKKTTPKQTIDDAWELYQRWQPVLCGIEVVAGQVTFFYWIPTVYPNMGIYKLKTDTHQRKNSRIRSACAPLGQQGRIYVRRDQYDFCEEWESFPSGRTVDLLDAFSYGPQLWAPPEGGSGDSYEEDDDDEFQEPQQTGANRVTGY